jgi:hypothetical protein
MMCRENKICLIIFLAALLLCCVWGAAHPQEQWYLITEPDLLTIERYRENSEKEKANWLLQVQKLSVTAGNLEAESASLNSQLQSQRELNRKLALSFNEYEQDQSLLLSRKNTQIIRLETENEQKDKVIARLIIALVTAGLVIIGFGAVKLLR